MDAERDDSPPTLGDLLRNLLDISTLPHIVLIGITGLILYRVSAEESLLAFGVAGYIGLAIGYALTGWFNTHSLVHRFSHVQAAPEGASFGERMKLYPVRVLASWLAPLSLGALPFMVISWFLTGPGASQVEYWALTIAGMFVVWSYMQGRAMANSLRIPVEARAARMESTDREGRLAASATTHILIIAGFAALAYWLLIIGYEKDRSLSWLEIGKMSLFTVFAAGVQFLLLRQTAERRAIDGRRSDTAAFGFTWGLLVQLFVTWHLLSALRRFTGGSWGLGVVIEELILMLLTVVAAIWTLAKDTHDRGLNLFTRDNAIFWGLAFGMAYAGSIAMIAVLGSRLSGGIFDYGLSGSVGIGHLITAGTMMWIHWWRIGSLSDWLTLARTRDEASQGEPEDDDWEETGWRSEEDVVGDSTSSIQGAEVDWEVPESDLVIPEPVTAENADQ